tara:strand:- start:107 stop:607 length:501 start_codon:yes stop_codon:yes gene_type:complete
MNNNKIKEKISNKVKNNVWKKYSLYNEDMRFSQCCTCENLIMIPNSIRKYYNLNYNILQVIIDKQIKNISGVAEFGHIISEKNGGKARENNLIIQCKHCNLSQGSNNIDFNYINKRDTLMLDSNYKDLDIEMGIYQINCSQKLKNGYFCKNKCMFNRDKCHIHIQK